MWPIRDDPLRSCLFLFAIRKGEMVMKKFEKDGMVAVLYSPGFGAGWYSWESSEEALFDPEIIQAVLDGSNIKAESIAEKKYPGMYLGGACDLQVEWIKKGSQFEIKEYDGNESVHVIGESDYLTA